MSEPLYPIKKGSFTFYIKSNYTGIEFELVGFTMNGAVGFYKKYHSEFFDEEVPGHPGIDIADYLFEKLKAEADARLNEYLEKHISDYSVYELTRASSGDFWSGAGKEPEHRLDRELDCSKILDGIVGLYLYGYTASYNFREDKFTGLKSRYGSEAREVTPMTALYGQSLDMMLALEQYKRGVAPPAYSEIIRLNAFLEGKKSLKLVMKSGVVHNLKSRCGDIHLYSLLVDTGNDFVLYDSYDITPRLGRNEPLTSLDYLQYGRGKFVIDTEALNTFEI